MTGTTGMRQFGCEHGVQCRCDRAWDCLSCGALVYDKKCSCGTAAPLRVAARIEAEEAVSK